MLPLLHINAFRVMEPVSSSVSPPFPSPPSQILSIVERNETSNDIEHEEYHFQNCITQSQSETADWYEQVEYCQSVTEPGIWYTPVIRVARRSYTSPLTGDTVPYGNVQVAYNVTWPVAVGESRDSPVFLISELAFTLPTSLSDLYFLGQFCAWGPCAYPTSYLNLPRPGLARVCAFQ